MAKVFRLALDSLKPEALCALQIMAMLSPDEISEEMLFGEWGDGEVGFLSASRRFEYVAAATPAISHFFERYL